ncbi:hypothetical protein [Sanguibacter massiliensis]|uniref:hypothetical protein n=1 Tax=Sanguibacter massiliensis TaxID=1973217 RepID=UPI000C8442A7|nr:hypothetical protein [Sanguibacter massiliensis]
MTAITRDQAQALAALIATMRPDWQTPGILKALSDARARGTGWDLAHAALYAAQDPSVRTPAVIALPGDHWRGRAIGDGTPLHFDRCPEPGHGSYRVDNCGACRSETLEATAPRVTEPGGVPMPDDVRAHIDRLKERSR